MGAFLVLSGFSAACPPVAPGPDKAARLIARFPASMTSYRPRFSPFCRASFQKRAADSAWGTLLDDTLVRPATGANGGDSEKSDSTSPENASNSLAPPTREPTAFVHLLCIQNSLWRERKAAGRFASKGRTI
jgi:hypothetical protein